MLLLRLICVGCANIVNKLSVKCNFVNTLHPHILHLNSRGWIQFGVVLVSTNIHKMILK